MKPDRPKPEPASPPMTVRGPDGRPHVTEAVEQSAADAQRTDRETPPPPPSRPLGPPD